MRRTRITLAGPLVIIAFGALVARGASDQSSGPGDAPPEGSPAQSATDPAQIRHGLFDQGPFSEDHPLGPDGVETTLGEAMSSAPFHVFRLDGSLGSDETIARVWLRTTTLPGVVIRYESGLVEYVSPWTADMTPEEFYRAIVSDGSSGRLLAVAGGPALTLPKSANGPLSLDTVIAGVDIVLIDRSGALSLDDLIKAIETLK